MDLRSPGSGRALGALLFAAAAALQGCGRGADGEPRVADPASLRHASQGPLVGFAHEDGGHAWLGIPFAKPPVGELRWRAPRPPEPWPGTLQALAPGPSCPQFAGLGGGRDGARSGEPSGSEDCLTLDIFAPRFEPDALPRGRERLPVMLWIHGGGNSIGDATLYDGGRIATSQQVVVVALQYRLGAFGWFSHPALRGEGTSPDDASGNYGTLDAVRALEWVRDEIAAFGGDPGRVLVFGESAGGSNTFALLLSPRAAGLFARAIVESGSPHTVTRAEAEHFRDDPREPGQEASSGEVIAKLLVREGRAADREGARRALAALPPAELAAWLRGRPAAELLTLYAGDRLVGMYDAPALIRDGAVLPPGDPLAALEQGRYNAVPTILGTNRDEAKLFLLFRSPHVTRLFGLPLWLNAPELYDADADYSTRLWKLRGVDGPARAMRASGTEVFAYRFDWDEQPGLPGLDLSRMLGAAHGLEIPFVFGWLSFGPATRLLLDGDRREQNEQLSRSIMSYWSQHAYAGSPGRGRRAELPAWPAWGLAEAAPRFMHLDSEDGGGLRLSSAELRREQILADVTRDPRLRSLRERCGVYALLAQRGDGLGAEEYARIEGGACSAYPLAAYPWGG